ncbi:MAG: COX15/CtaA family protein [Planctomycetota bacterium]|jgi:heme A synthase
MTSTTASPSPAAPSLRGPFRLAVGVMVAMAATVLKGALTTSTGSGMAYPDWPLSNGQVMPETSYTTVAGFLEHFHRLAAATTGLLALALALWLQFGFAGRVAGRALATAWIGGCLILAQGVIGGVGVLKNTPVLTSVTHGTLAQLVFATFALLAYQLTDRYRTTVPLPGVAPGTGRRIAVAAVVLMVVQTVLGAIGRHANSGHAIWTHAGHALVVFFVATIATAMAVGKLGAAPGIRTLSRWIVTLLMTQIALGFVVLAVRNPKGKSEDNVDNLGVAFTISMHVVIGAALTVLLATLAAHVFRSTRRAGGGAPGVEEAFR